MFAILSYTWKWTSARGGKTAFLISSCLRLQDFWKSCEGKTSSPWALSSESATITMLSFWRVGRRRPEDRARRGLYCRERDERETRLAKVPCRRVVRYRRQD